MKTILVVLFLISPAVAFAYPGNPAPENVGVQTQTTITATTASTKFLNQNINRHYLLIQNQGSSNVLIKADAGFFASEGFIIAAGASYEPHPPLTDAFYVKSASSTDSVFVIEGTK